MWKGKTSAMVAMVMMAMATADNKTDSTDVMR
jgi:hypothetical protein